MLFSVRMVTRRPATISYDAWQALVLDQLRAVKSHLAQGKVRSIFRETGSAVLAIYETIDARELDLLLAGMPMFRFFDEVEVHPLWDLSSNLG